MGENTTIIAVLGIIGVVAIVGLLALAMTRQPTGGILTVLDANGSVLYTIADIPGPGIATVYRSPFEPANQP